CAQRIAAQHAESVRRKPEALGLDARIEQPLAEQLARGLARVRANRQGGLLVVEFYPRRGCFRAHAVQPSFDQPSRVRARQSERIEPGLARASRFWGGRLRE